MLGGDEWDGVGWGLMGVSQDPYYLLLTTTYYLLLTGWGESGAECDAVR